MLTPRQLKLRRKKNKWVYNSGYIHNNNSIYWAQIYERLHDCGSSLSCDTKILINVCVIR